MRFLTLLALFVTATSPAMAQVVVQNTAPVTFYPQFFATLLSGVLLAFGLQLLLTTLSLALGLSMTPNLKKAYAKQQANSWAEDDAVFSDTIDNDTGEPDRDGMKVTSAIGLWAMITSSIALFVASWLAVHLSVTPYQSSGVILGLVIWAAFFMLMTYFEIKSVSTLIGGLIGSALSGIRASFSGLSRMMGASPEAQAEQAVRRSVRGMYEEVSQLMSHSNIEQKLEQYLTRLQPKEIDYGRIGAELAAIVSQIEIEERTQLGDQELSRLIDVHLGQKHPMVTKEKAGQMKDVAMDAIRTARSNRGAGVSGMAGAVIDRLAPMNDADARAYRDKLAQYLRDTGRDELSPESLSADLERMFHDPKGSVDVLKQRLALFDRGTLQALLTGAGMDESKASGWMRTLENAFTSLSEKYGSAQQGSTDRMDQLSSTARQAYNDGRDRLAGLPAVAEARIQTFFNNLERPELDYNELKADLQQMFSDPTHAPGVLKERLGRIDRETVIALLSANSRISREQAEAITEQVLSAKDSAFGKIDDVTQEVSRRYELMKRKSVIAAEHTRQNTIAASWWTLGAAFASAVAAAAGGYVAAM